MKRLILTLFILGYYPVYSQDIKISFENKDSSVTGERNLAFIKYGNLGIETLMLIRGNAEFISDSDSVLCFLLSTSSMLGGILYLRRGDSVSVLQESGSPLKYSGSKEVEHNLVEELYANDIQGYGPIRGDIEALPLKRLIPYIKNKLSTLNQVVENYIKKYPSIDLKILEIIKNDAKYSYLKSAIQIMVHLDYSEENCQNLTELLKDDDLKVLADIEYRSSFATNLYQKEYLNFLFYKKNKEKILSVNDSGYFQQLKKRFKFYLEFDDPVRDEVYFNNLRDFFNLQTWKNESIQDYTKDYLMFSENNARKEFIRKHESKILFLQNTELQAKTILSDTVVRNQLLLKPDGTEISFGQLLDSLHYKWVYLDAWATWCAPCRQEMNKINVDIIKKMKAKVIFFSIDDDIEKWKVTINKQYSFDGRVEHYRLDKNSILASKLFGDTIFIPKYSLFNVSRNRFYHNVSKPTVFDLENTLK